MTSAHALKLKSEILENDPTKAAPLLLLLHAFANSRGDPLAEAMTWDVMLDVYRELEHCRESMESFISQRKNDQSPLAA